MSILDHFIKKRNNTLKRDISSKSMGPTILAPKSLPTVNIPRMDTVSKSRIPWHLVSEQAQVRAVERGIKPVAMVSPDVNITTAKHKNLFSIPLKHMNNLGVEEFGIPPDLVVYRPETESRANTLINIYKERDTTKNPMTPEIHTQIGRLLGYKEKNIQRFNRGMREQKDIDKAAQELYPNNPNTAFWIALKEKQRRGLVKKNIYEPSERLETLPPYPEAELSDFPILDNTSNSMGVISGRDLPIQEHVGASRPLPYFRGVGHSVLEVGKPRGGFWTSSLSPTGRTEWRRFAKQTIPEKIDTTESMTLLPNPDAKIFQIASKKDYRTLLKKYPIDRFADVTGKSPTGEHLMDIDWPLVAKDYDAINITQDAAERLKFGTPGLSEARHNPWEAESTVWFNPAFKQISGETTVDTKALGIDTDDTSNSMAWKYPDDYEWGGETKTWRENYTEYQVPIQKAYHARSKYMVRPKQSVILGYGPEDRELIKQTEQELIASKKYEDTYGPGYAPRADVERVALQKKRDKLAAEAEAKGLIVYPSPKPSIKPGSYHASTTLRIKQPKSEYTLEPQYAQPGSKKGEEPEHYIERMVKALESPKPLVPVLTISHNEAEKGVWGEGRHRTIAAMRKGDKTMPILVEKSWQDPGDKKLAGFGIQEKPYYPPITTLPPLVFDRISPNDRFTKSITTPYGTTYYNPEGTQIHFPKIALPGGRPNPIWTTKEDVAYALEDLPPALSKNLKVVITTPKQYHLQQAVEDINRLEKRQKELAEEKEKYIKLWNNPSEGEKAWDEFQSRQSAELTKHEKKYLEKTPEIIMRGAQESLERDKHRTMGRISTEHIDPEKHLSKNNKRRVIHLFPENITSQDPHKRYNKFREVIHHEIGHHEENKVPIFSGETPFYKDSEEYKWYNSTAPSWYGTTNAVEDFAETFAIQQGPFPKGDIREEYGPGTPAFEDRIKSMKEHGVVTERYPTVRELTYTENPKEGKILKEAAVDNISQSKRLNYLQMQRLKNIAVGYSTIPSITPRTYEYVPNLPPEGITVKHLTAPASTRYEKIVKQRALNIIRKNPLLISEMEKSPAETIFYQGPKDTNYRGRFFADTNTAFVDLRPKSSKYLTGKQDKAAIASDVLHEARHAQQYAENPEQEQKIRAYDASNVPWAERDTEKDAEAYAHTLMAESRKGRPGGLQAYATPEEAFKVKHTNIDKAEYDTLMIDLEQRKQAELAAVEERKTAGIEMLDRDNTSNSMAYALGHITDTGMPELLYDDTKGSHYDIPSHYDSGISRKDKKWLSVIRKAENVEDITPHPTVLSFRTGKDVTDKRLNPYKEDDWRIDEHKSEQYAMIPDASTPEELREARKKASFKTVYDYSKSELKKHEPKLKYMLGPSGEIIDFI